jgi:hypothetical protein
MYLVVIYSIAKVICDILIITNNGAENAYGHGVFNDVLSSPTFNAFV